MWTLASEYKYVGSPSVGVTSPCRLLQSAEPEGGSWSMDLAWTHDCYADVIEVDSNLGS